MALLPFECDQGTWGFSHSILECGRSSNLFKEIRKLKEEPVPASFKTFCSRDDAYEDIHYGETQETPYGEKLGWVYAKDLWNLGDHAEVKDNVQNMAVWAYLAELGAKTKIALYWH